MNRVVTKNTMPVVIQETPWTSKSLADTFKLWSKYAPETPVFVEVNGQEVPLTYLIEDNFKIVLHTTPHPDDTDAQPPGSPGR